MVRSNNAVSRNPGLKRIIRGSAPNQTNKPSGAKINIPLKIQRAPTTNPPINSRLRRQQDQSDRKPKIVKAFQSFNSLILEGQFTVEFWIEPIQPCI